MEETNNYLTKIPEPIHQIISKYYMPYQRIDIQVRANIYGDLQLSSLEVVIIQPEIMMRQQFNFYYYFTNSHLDFINEKSSNIEFNIGHRSSDFAITDNYIEIGTRKDYVKSRSYYVTNDHPVYSILKEKIRKALFEATQKRIALEMI